MKKYTALLIGVLVAGVAVAQPAGMLTISDCYSLAVKNYPLIRQLALIEKTKTYSIDNAAKGNFPQINFNAQGTYQSEVTAIKIPGIITPVIDKDQYRMYAEVNQSLTDAVTIKQQKALIKANAAIETQKIEVELYKLKERINQLYFGILLIDAQMDQVGLLKKDIQSGLNKVNAAITNGTALRSNGDMLQAELLKTDQHAIELKAAYKGYLDMLAVFIGQPLGEQTRLQAPAEVLVTTGINRPELALYATQKKTFTIQRKLIDDKNIPRLGVFVQGGYGRPALNMLSNAFDPYYIGGIRLNWNFSGLYTAKKEKALLKINEQSIDVQKETFIFNTELSLLQQNSEVGKYRELISTDNAIIQLREKVKQAADAQLENGVITTNDYVTYLNAEDQAKQNLLLHQVQLQLALYNYQTTSGN